MFDKSRPATRVFHVAGRFLPKLSSFFGGCLFCTSTRARKPYEFWTILQVLSSDERFMRDGEVKGLAHDQDPSNQKTHIMVIMERTILYSLLTDTF